MDLIDAGFQRRVERVLRTISQAMTTQEIQKHIDAAIGSKFKGITSESGEMMTSEGGDGRFFGQVIATRYSGFPNGSDIYLAIGKSEKLVQIVKFGNTEGLKPTPTDLDLMILKELGGEMPQTGAESGRE